MPPKELFKDKPLRIGVVAALATITTLPVNALLLPQKPLALSSSWDCQAGKDSDWLCRSSASADYDQTLERASYSSNRYSANNQSRRKYYEQKNYSPDDEKQVYENQAYVNQGYEKQGYENRAYVKQGYEKQGYENRAYVNQGYEKQGYENRAYVKQGYENRIDTRNTMSRQSYSYSPPEPQQMNPAIKQYSSYKPEQRYASNDQEVAQTKFQNLLSSDNSNHHVVQWLAAHDQSALRDLQSRFSFLEQATVVSYRRNNKVWYVLLDGPFASRGAAMAALSSPPRLLVTDKLYPWTRSLSSIQKLDLIMPDEVDPVPDYEQPTVVDQYDYQPTTQQPSNRLFASITPAYPQIDSFSQADSFQEARDYNSPYDPAETQYHSQDEQYRSRNERYNHYNVDNLDIDQNYRPEQRGSSGQDRYSGQRSYQPSRWQSSPRGSDQFKARSQARRYYEEPAQPKETPYSPRKTYKPKQTAQKDRYEEGAKTDPINRNILDAPDGSYTLQWLSSPRRETLERAKRRYSQLNNAEIVQFRKAGRKWYLLVSEIYFSESQANQALGEPWLARLSTRFYPRIRSVNSLRVLLSGKSITKQQPLQVKASSPLNELIKGPDGSYTIQWFAANSPAAVEKMKNRFPELRSAVTAYYRKKQKDWYVLIQGQYSNSKEAINAIKSPQLQSAVRVLHPWTRPVKSLKKLKISDA